MTTAVEKPIICPVIVGRDHELAALGHLLKRTSSGQGQMLLLSGEAGIGKSRLVAELKISATDQGLHVLEGKCFPADFNSPYAPLRDLLRSYLDSLSPTEIVTAVGPFACTLAPLLPERVSLLPALASLPPLPSLDPEQEQRRLFVALADFFTRQTEHRPLLLIVEDVHWSDESSLEYLNTLARQMTREPVMILCTYRSDEVHPRLSHWLAQLDREHVSQEVTLARLTRSETEAMLRAIFAEQQVISGELLETLWQLTDGNPFFLEEVLKSGLSNGGITFTESGWAHDLRAAAGRVAIPRSVQDAVQQRARRLSPPARQLLTLAAVAGRRFDVRVLQHLLHCTDAQLLPLLKAVVAAQLVVEESADQFSFRHALTRQAIYAGLLARERRAMHRHLAQAIERLFAGGSALDAHLADLAYHYYEGEDWERALEYGQRAGEQAQALYAPQATVEHFTRALDAARRLSLTLPSGLYRARGLAYETLGDFERARADYEAALQAAHLVGDRHEEWQSLIDLGFLWTGRDYAQSGHYYQQGLVLARTLDDPATVARSLNHLGNWHLNAERMPEALRCHQEALALFEGVHDRSGTASTLDLLGMACVQSGDPLHGAAYYEQAIVLFRELDERERLPSSLTSLMAGMCCGGHALAETLVPIAMDFGESLKHGELALKIAGEIGQRPDEAYALIQIAFCLGAQGQYARALVAAQRGLAVAEEIEHRQWTTAGHCALGALALDVLALSQARLHLEQAMALAQEIRSQFWARCSVGLLARVYLLQHDPAGSESLLSSWLSPDTPFHTAGQRAMWQSRAELLLVQGDAAQALQVIEELVSTAANLTPEHCIPLLWKLRAEALIHLRRYDEVESLLQQAETSAQRQGLRPLLWRVWLVQARLAQRLRRHDEAEQAFVRASQLIEELAAALPERLWRPTFLQQAHSLIPRTGPLSTRRRNKEAFNGLTEREREVAALIAQGKSNREIADTLVVGVRTVEAHISNIFSKLGCSSRAQIASWATEKGLTSHRYS